jgi:hypothetical protein
MEVSSPAMAEMSDVKFVSINALYNELRRIKDFQRILFSRKEKNSFPYQIMKPHAFQCNFSNVSREDFPTNHSYWLRDFLLSWFLTRAGPLFGEVTMKETREKIKDPSLHPELFREFPSKIHLPGMTEDEEPLSLVLPTAEELQKQTDQRICQLCRATCDGAFYSCCEEEKAGRDISTHIRCALRKVTVDATPSEHVTDNPMRRVITEKELSREFHRLPFFESRFLRFIRNPSNYSSVSTVAADRNQQHRPHPSANIEELLSRMKFFQG